MAERRVNGALLPDAEPQTNGGIGRTSKPNQAAKPHPISTKERQRINIWKTAKHRSIVQQGFQRLKSSELNANSSKLNENRHSFQL